jgi:hypothetical protein
MPLIVQPVPPDRLHVTPDDKPAVHHLMKVSGKTHEEVVAAIEKVAGNLESVARELGCKSD